LFIIKNLITLTVIIFLTTLAKPILANNTQTNESGSNTLIDGNMTTNNTYDGGQTNTTTATTTNSSTASKIPVSTASAPSYSAMSQDVCSMGISGSVSSSLIGLSGGKHVYDEECIRIKYAKVIHDFGMKVSSITLLCQKKSVFMAMMEANTPCPFQGLLGEKARLQWEKYPKLRPDYKEYMERVEYMAKIDLQFLIQEGDNDPFDNIPVNIHKQ
jgi:hypothetical protein|tara:strand:+ start:181 stop:825 length:645 start_codon:yes stop_codon:yes gene_type:complete